LHPIKQGIDHWPWLAIAAAEQNLNRSRSVAQFTEAVKRNGR